MIMSILLYAITAILEELRIPSECKKIAIPVIGCGLDGLEWCKVSEIIKEVFKGTDIEILVCKQK